VTGGKAVTHSFSAHQSQLILAITLFSSISRRSLWWNTDTLKLLSMGEGCIPTTRVPGGYNVAIGTSQQKTATATSVGVLKYNW
jgi:hypothetical protein